MGLLCVAQVLVKLVPLRFWRRTLGRIATEDAVPQGCARAARRIAVHVERGAARLPFATKCLPRAMALCWLLRRAGIGYALKIAARPAAVRGAALPMGDDLLHAWVESGNATVLGALPGPWLVVLTLAASGLRPITGGAALHTHHCHMWRIHLCKSNWKGHRPALSEGSEW
jgi:hypothetical protein